MLRHPIQVKIITGNKVVRILKSNGSYYSGYIQDIG
jgi:hypothetical protein